jgi:hypothetical protein
VSAGCAKKDCSLGNPLKVACLAQGDHQHSADGVSALSAYPKVAREPTRRSVIGTLSRISIGVYALIIAEIYNAEGARAASEGGAGKDRGGGGGGGGRTIERTPKNAGKSSG